MLARIVVVLLLILMPATPVFAGNITFIKEYTYRAGDIDSKVSSRAIALDQVKRLLLEELGTYLISETEVKNYQITKDQITTLTAGIVMTSIIDEKWDGKDYFLKAKITTDPKEVAKFVDALRRDKEYSKELDAAKKRADAALQELSKLKKALGASKPVDAQQNDYDKAIINISANELYYTGFAFLNAANYRDAINTFNKAIALNPRSAEAFSNRGLAYNNLGNYDLAIKDYNSAIFLDSQSAQSYWRRGISYANVGDDKHAVLDYQKAIEIDPLFAAAYYNLGKIYLGYSNNNRHSQDAERFKNEAMRNYQIALKLGNPNAIKYFANQDELTKKQLAKIAEENARQKRRNEAETYLSKGEKRKYYNEAIADYNKAIELDPDWPYAYNVRGAAYYALGEKQLAARDYNKFIELKNGNLYNPLSWYECGVIYHRAENYRSAIYYYDLAVKYGDVSGFSSAERTLFYNNRGNAYNSIKDYQQALKDYGKAIELDSTSAMSYWNRSIVYAQIRDELAAMQDRVKAAKLGYEAAQIYLTTIGVRW